MIKHYKIELNVVVNDTAQFPVTLNDIIQEIKSDLEYDANGVIVAEITGHEVS